MDAKARPNHAVYLRVLRRMSPEARSRKAFELSALAQALFRTGGSEKHFVDALRVYEVEYGRLDQSYLDASAARLAATALLNRLRAEAEPIE